MTSRLAALLAALLFSLAVPAHAATQPNQAPYVICKNQTYALCAAAEAFVYQDLAYAKCQVKKGDSISAPPLYYQKLLDIKNICDVNAIGASNGYMMSTFSLPPEVKKGGSKALYTCPGGATGKYAQCDGGTCFKSTVAQYFPGVGQLGKDQIICSCPMTTPTTSNAPFGYQFIGPYPCQQKAFAYCTQNVQNGSIVPVGSPPGAGRILTQALYGQSYQINECTNN